MANIPEGKKLYPLSDAQKTLRLAEIFSIEKKKTKEANVLGFYVKTPADTNYDADKKAKALEAALNYIIRYNDSLRLRFIKKSGKMLQYIADHEDRVVECINVDGEKGMQNYLEKIDRYPVNWYDDSMVWAKTLVMSPNQCAMILRIHHAVIDGYSVRIMFEQFKSIYFAYLNGEEIKAPAKAYSITAYFNSLEEYRGSKQHDEDYAYWKHVYTSQRKYRFPAGRRAERAACANTSIKLEKDLYMKILNMSREYSCTLQCYMMTMAALTTYVLSNKDNFCICSLSHGRNNFMAKKTVGCMQNTVQSFYDIDINKPVTALIENAYSDFLEALSHSRLPTTEHTPLGYMEALKNGLNFNHCWIMFSAMEFGTILENSTDLYINILPKTNLPHQLYVAMLEIPGDHITFNLEYQVRKYSLEQANRMLETYLKVCSAVVENPQITPKKLRETILK